MFIKLYDYFFWCCQVVKYERYIIVIVFFEGTWPPWLQLCWMVYVTMTLLQVMKKNQTKGTLKLLEALRHHQNESHENWQWLAMVHLYRTRVEFLSFSEYHLASGFQTLKFPSIVMNKEDNFFNARDDLNTTVLVDMERLRSI